MRKINLRIHNAACQLCLGKEFSLYLFSNGFRVCRIKMSVEWKTEAFRSSLVRKLEEAIKESGTQNQKTAVELEKTVRI